MAWTEVYGGQRSLAFELTTAIIDLDDPQRRWILWIIPKTGYLKHDPRRFFTTGPKGTEYCQR